MVLLADAYREDSGLTEPVDNVLMVPSLTESHVLLESGFNVMTPSPSGMERGAFVFLAIGHW